MKKENIENENVNPGRRRGIFHRTSRKTRLSILFLALLAVGALGAAGLNQVMPRPPNRAQGYFDRLAYYLNQGQMRADLHTLAHVVEYAVASEITPPTATAPPNERLTENARPTSPKS